ncbi:hypothetical protein V5N11_012172 [Cardamine amara subsp. amara]|uniref:RNase H type-1 domain-containing protein n=1 Tax=Cardamine amara subsp. amara TaxID=228776 RepID=A0ABD0ZKK1_CARAN
MLLAEALGEAEEWTRLNADGHDDSPCNTKGQSERKRLCRPPIGILKCDVNSSWVNGFLRCGGAWIVRDCNGDAQFHARDVFLTAQNRIASELRCILWAVNSILDLRLPDLEIWSRLWCSDSSYKSTKILSKISVTGGSVMEGLFEVYVLSSEALIGQGKHGSTEEW